MGGFTLPGINTYSKAAVIQIVCCWGKDREKEE